MAEKISPSAKKVKLDVVQKPPPRRPNAFVAIPFDDSNIRSKIKQVQEIITQKEPKLSKACVPIDKSHITLFVHCCHFGSKSMRVSKSKLSVRRN